MKNHDNSTGLLFGGRERKDSPRMEALGDLDELNSFLGLAKCDFRRGALRQVLEEVQEDLIVLSSELVVSKGREKELKRRIDQSCMDRLQLRIAEAERRNPIEGRSFSIPGENRASALLDVCRAIARRAERRVITLQRKARTNPLPARYLNRLSTLLFILARAAEPRHNQYHQE